jgi:hypothetical protein
MTWLAWRLQRTETLIVAVILVLLAALLIPTGINMSKAYNADHVGSCLALKANPTCAVRINDFQSRFQSIKILANWFTLIPGLIGVLLAAPFVLDLEHRTYRLAWTQSITRRRWLAGKLGLPIAVALVSSGLWILLFTWWRQPMIKVDGRLDIGNYDTTGVVVIGYTLFALGLAVALGAVWRRSAVSLTLAFVAYFAVRVFVDYSVRNRLVSPLTVTYHGLHRPSYLDKATIISEHGVINGHHVNGGGAALIGGSSQLAAPGLGAHSIFTVVYQPESHYWPLQLREMGLFAGLGVALILFAAWWTQRRTA